MSGPLFANEPVSLDRQIAEVRRELAMRQRLYPNWIARGTLKQRTADEQLHLLTAVLQTLMDLKAAGVVS